MLKIIICVTILVTIISSAAESTEYNSEPPRFEKFLCLNGKDPATLSHKDNLREFAKGPCSPLMILPSLLSTRLVLDIECRVLRKENPQLFKACGWNACSKRFYQVYRHVPDPQYNIWLPSIFGPLSIARLSSESNSCWTTFIQLSINFNKPLEEAVKPTKGFRVRVLGLGKHDDPNESHECGNKALYNITGYSHQMSKLTVGLKPAFDMLQQMGYVPGLTYQSLPYDFRLSVTNNGVDKVFNSNIERLSLLTGKKVILVGHSFGSINIYRQLLAMDPAFKKRHVKLWLGLGVPLLGTVKVLQLSLFGISELLYLNKSIGLHYKSQMEWINRMLSIYELMPVDPFTNFKGSEWIEAVEKRIRYEKGEVPFEESGFSFLPKKEEACSPDNFENFPTACLMGLTDTSKDNLITIMGEGFKMNQLDKVFERFPITGHMAELYELTKKTRDNELDNPGVPFVSLFSRTVSTSVNYSSDTDPFIAYKNDEFTEIKKTYGYGDSTVAANSQLIPALKWAREFEQGVNGAHPVKIVDFCSTYNVKYDVYDTDGADGGAEIKKNEFMGIYCDCMKQKNSTQCQHFNIVHDKEVLKLLLNTLQDKTHSYTPEYETYIESLEDNFLEAITTVCPQLNSTPRIRIKSALAARSKLVI